ncbi:MAG TPA: killer suppression protein [Chloroflexia bacterium]
MKIVFSSHKLEKECNDDKLRVKRFGPRRAQLIGRRLNGLEACETLEVARTLRGTRCHELKGDRAGQLSVDLDHPYRLLFTPADEPVPKKEDGGLDWGKVTAIMILGVENTHE